MVLINTIIPIIRVPSGYVTLVSKPRRDSATLLCRARKSHCGSARLLVEKAIRLDVIVPICVLCWTRLDASSRPYLYAQSLLSAGRTDIIFLRYHWSYEHPSRWSTAWSRTDGWRAIIAANFSSRRPDNGGSCHSSPSQDPGGSATSTTT